MQTSSATILQYKSCCLTVHIQRIYHKGASIAKEDWPAYVTWLLKIEVPGALGVWHLVLYKVVGFMFSVWDLEHPPQILVFKCLDSLFALTSRVHMLQTLSTGHASHHVELQTFSVALGCPSNNGARVPDLSCSCSSLVNCYENR